MKLIALLLLLPVITWAAGAADTDADFDGRLRTEHFDFRFPAHQGPAVRDIARFAEGFLAVLQKDFFDPKLLPHQGAGAADARGLPRVSAVPSEGC